MSLVCFFIHVKPIFFFYSLEGLHAVIRDNCLRSVSEVPIEIVFIDLLKCFTAFKRLYIGIGGISSLLFEFLY